MALGRGIQAGKAFVEFILSDKKLHGQLDRIGGKLQSIGARGLAATAPLIAGFTGAALKFASAGDQLDKMSKRTGVSASALSELRFAAQQSGAELPIVEKGLKRMSTTLLDARRGSAEAVESLELLGVNLQSLQKMKPEDQFETLGEALGRISDPTRKAALAQKIFGRAGTQLIPLFNEGAKGIAALRQQARDLGITLSNEDAVAAAKLTDALNATKQQLTALAIRIGAAVAGPLTAFLEWSQAIITPIIEWIRQNELLVQIMAGVTFSVATLSIGLIALGTAMKLYKVAAIGATIATKVFRVALLLLSTHPIIGALTLIAAGIAAVVGWFGWGSDAADDFGESLSDVKTVPGLPKSSAAFQAQQAQARLSSVTGGAGVRPAGAAAIDAKPTPARDYGAEIAKATRETADGIAEMLRIARYNPLTAGSSLIAQFLP